MNAAPWDSADLWLLRTKYRCTMCHKKCLVPCRFTAAEFRQLAASGEGDLEGNGTSPDDGRA